VCFQYLDILTESIQAGMFNLFFSRGKGMGRVVALTMLYVMLVDPSF